VSTYLSYSIGKANLGIETHTFGGMKNCHPHSKLFSSYLKVRYVS